MLITKENFSKFITRSSATVCAYFVLLIYTVLLIVSLVLALFFAENIASAYFSLIIYVAAYPFVYIGVAWIFYYGLSRRV